jgi:hypothetical protein
MNDWTRADLINLLQLVVTGLIGASALKYAALQNRILEKQNEIFGEQKKLNTLLIQRERTDALETEFERCCKSVEAGLDYIQIPSGKFQGGAAIIRIGDMCEMGQSTFEEAVDKMTIDGLKAVAAGLIAFIEWMDAPEIRDSYHEFFRVRFMVLILAFEKILKSAGGGNFLSEENLLLKFADDPRRHAFAVIIRRLVMKEQTAWMHYEQEQDVQH